MRTNETDQKKKVHVIWKYFGVVFFFFLARYKLFKKQTTQYYKEKSLNQASITGAGRLSTQHNTCFRQ